MNRAFTEIFDRAEVELLRLRADIILDKMVQLTKIPSKPNKFFAAVRKYLHIAQVPKQALFPEWLQVLTPTPSDGDENTAQGIDELRGSIEAQGRATSHNLDWVQNTVVDRVISGSQQGTELASLRKDIGNMMSKLSDISASLSQLQANADFA